MQAYFITGSTFAAPFVGEKVEGYVKANTAEDALLEFAAVRTSFPYLYAANAYESADAFHKGLSPCAEWRSNKCQHDEKNEDYPNDDEAYLTGGSLV